jgi:hypothetical protein
MRFDRGANVRFHFACASVRKTPFTRTASKMSRHFARQSSSIFEIALVLVRFDHFVIAVWRAKEAECARREGMANDGNLGSAFSVTRTR